jgi:hypothetical protein
MQFQSTKSNKNIEGFLQEMNLASTGNALQKVLEEARRALLDDDEIEDEESYH